MSTAAVLSRPLAGLFAALLVMGPAAPQHPGTTPTDAGPAPHWRYLRHDPASLMRLGDGDLQAGLNRLGEVGMELFLVTTANPEGAAGWLYFRQAPWTSPLPQPRVEYKVLDDPAITSAGDGDYGSGLNHLARQGWTLVAITTTAGGGVGFSYFLRDQSTDGRLGSTSPPEPAAAGVPRTPPGPASADFSTPRAALATLLAAAAAQDVSLLARCFAPSAAEEFAPLRDGTASAESLAELAALFAGATIGDEVLQGPEQATVGLRYGGRQEEASLARAATGWQIVDF
jgi:hypothetical protein